MPRASTGVTKRTSSKSEVLIPLVRAKGRLRAQIEDGIRQAVRSGRLSPNTGLPSSRLLARDLGVSRGIVVGAYEQLTAEGFLVSRPGGRTAIASRLKRVGGHPEPFALPPPRYDFKPGVPDVREFPWREWNRATKSALHAGTNQDLGYGDMRGSLVLRIRLAEYLGRVRAVDTVPNQIMICGGVTQALGIAVKALIARGIDRMALEAPSHPDLRRLIAAAGASAVAVRVDESGVVVRDLANTGAKAVIVTPTHQFPTGAVLSGPRRHELVAWAAACDGFIIEDDYDSEYRYDGTSVGAIQGLAPDRVIYTSSTSKILAPGLRLGWMCLPAPLLHAAIDTKRLADLGSPILEQLIYAAFIESGGLARHLRRTRLLYRARRDVLVRTLTALTSWRIEGIAAGLHLVAHLPVGSDERRIVTAARRRDVGFHPLSDYRTTTSPSQNAALVFGYGHLTDQEIEDGVRQAFSR
jgi:GntR family transcriptional regulator/MocR family aminotransferase